MRSPRHCLTHRLKLFGLVLFAKFGSQTLCSVMIGATPVVLKGPRHMMSWLFAFACIQLCPRDSVYAKLQSNAGLLVVVRIGCALYKLRKFNFVADFGLDRSFAWMVAAQIISIDGNNLVSRLWTWGWLRGCSATTAADVGVGLRALLHRIIPVVLASYLVRYVAGTISTLMKLLVFALFLWRYDVPRLIVKLLAACRSRRDDDACYAQRRHFAPAPHNKHD